MGDQLGKVPAVLPNPQPEPGFRWARSVEPWVHLTRDDHAGFTMFLARALWALVQGYI